jgi:hypothetical protein
VDGYTINSGRLKKTRDKRQEMRNYIVHIGYHKTGTTWFQKMYFDLHPGLTRISRKFISENFIEPGSFEFDAEEVQAKLFFITKDFDEEKVIVLSEEELSGNPHSGGKGGYAEKEIAERLFRVFQDKNVKIAIFIRNQKDMIQSSYNQYVKMGGRNTIKNYLFPPKQGARRDLFAFSYFKYEKLIGYYIDLFGKDKVKVFLYEEFKHDAETFLDCFSNALDIECSPELFKHSQYVNLSIPDYSIGLLRWINSISRVSDLNSENMIDIPYLSRALRVLLQKIPGGQKKQIISQEIGDYINDYYKESNNELARICGIDVEKLKKYGYSI